MYYGLKGKPFVTLPYAEYDKAEQFVLNIEVDSDDTITSIVFCHYPDLTPDPRQADNAYWVGKKLPRDAWFPMVELTECYIDHGL